MKCRPLSSLEVKQCKANCLALIFACGLSRSKPKGKRIEYECKGNEKTAYRRSRNFQGIRMRGMSMVKAA